MNIKTIVLLTGLCAILTITNAADTRYVISNKNQQKGLEASVFRNLKAALRGSGSSWQAMNYLKPGGTILVHAGTYKADRYAYRDGHGLMYFGTHFPAHFSPHMKWMGGEKPEALTIKAAGDGEVILDGADCNILMDLTATVPVVIEGITFQNADAAIVAGERGGVPCAGLTLRNCTFRNVQVGVWADNPSAENYVIENCTFEGKEGRETIGVKLAGKGHKVTGNTFAKMSKEKEIVNDYQPLPQVEGSIAMMDDMPAKSGKVSGDAVVPGTFKEDAPTLHCLAFTWWIEGDANRNARVDVAYRKKGDGDWKEAMPLFRPDMDANRWGKQHQAHHDWHKERQDLFAGSIPNLEPGTEYECRLTMTDADGGKAEKVVSTATKAEPKLPSGGRTIHVYPNGFSGTKASPNAPSLDIAANNAKAGDIVLLHAGTYKPTRKPYSDANGNLTLGGYQIRAQGTTKNYVVIKAAGDGEVIIDGDGGECVLDVRFSQYLRVDGITLRNAEIGVKAGHTSTQSHAVVPCRGFMLKNCKVDNVFIGLWGLNPKLEGFRIMDNHFIARPWTGKGDKWKHLYSEAGIDLNGTGHVVAYNRIEQFWDGVNFYGEAVAMDFYNNIVSHQKDNSFGNGANGYCRNIRIWHNNWGGGGPCMHLHPTVGPVLMFRNYVRGGGFFKLQFGRTNGIQYYHNVHDLGWSRVGGIERATGKLDLRNNIWQGGICELGTLSRESTVDYNGWQKPKKKWQYKTPSGKGTFDTAEALSKAIGWCGNGVVVDNLRAVLSGATLKDGVPFIDKAVRIPTINDGYKGDAPDIGMVEFGDTEPTYGPRK